MARIKAEKIDYEAEKSLLNICHGTAKEVRECPVTGQIYLGDTLHEIPCVEGKLTIEEHGRPRETVPCTCLTRHKEQLAQMEAQVGRERCEYLMERNPGLSDRTRRGERCTTTPEQVAAEKRRLYERMGGALPSPRGES